MVHGYGCLAADPLCFPEQDIVARQAEDVVHDVALAPAHQVLAREATCAAQQDVDVGPSFADHPDDAADLVARAPGAVDVGGSELGEQEMAAAEDVEGQETAVFVVAVEEGVLLAPMGLHVGGVDIEGDARGRRLVGVEKQGDEQVGEFLEVCGDLMVPAIAGVPGVLDAVQRRFAGQRRRAFTGGRRRLAAAIGEELARRIVAQGVVIVDVFIAQGDARDPLGQEGGKGVDRPGRVTPVAKAVRHAFEQAYPACLLAQ